MAVNKLTENAIDEKHEAVIVMLKDQRYQIDDILQEIAGDDRFRKDLFDAEDINIVVQHAFRDVVGMIEVGRIDRALSSSKEFSEKKWL